MRHRADTVVLPEAKAEPADTVPPEAVKADAPVAPKGNGARGLGMDEAAATHAAAVKATEDATAAWRKANDEYTAVATPGLPESTLAPRRVALKAADKARQDARAREAHAAQVVEAVALRIKRTELANSAK
jgi:hypothetical protein